MELVKLSPEEKSEIDVVFEKCTEAEQKLADLVMQKMNLESQITQQAQLLSGLRGELQNRATIMGRMHGLKGDEKAKYVPKDGAFHVERDKPAPVPTPDKGPHLKSVKKEKP